MAPITCPVCGVRTSDSYIGEEDWVTHTYFAHKISAADAMDFAKSRGIKDNSRFASWWMEAIELPGWEDWYREQVALKLMGGT
jgi:hypothetical protein